MGEGRGGRGVEEEPGGYEEKTVEASHRAAPTAGLGEAGRSLELCL